jgi:delta8-fatty-acid desaturase
VRSLANRFDVSAREQRGSEPLARPGSTRPTHSTTVSDCTPQIVLSHYSRSTADLGPFESFPHRQLRTTTDVICHPYAEFLHGGLHLQVTHHLFPRLPRHNLKEASYLVKEFAKKQGLEYAEFGFLEGNGEVLDTLKGVANQLKIIKMVADSEIHEALNAKTD